MFLFFFCSHFIFVMVDFYIFATLHMLQAIAALAKYIAAIIQQPQLPKQDEDVVSNLIKDI